MSKCTNINIEQIQKMNKKSFLKSAICYIIVFLVVLALVIFLSLHQTPKNKKVEISSQFCEAMPVYREYKQEGIYEK